MVRQPRLGRRERATSCASAARACWAPDGGPRAPGPAARPDHLRAGGAAARARRVAPAVRRRAAAPRSRTSRWRCAARRPTPRTWRPTRGSAASGCATRSPPTWPHILAFALHMALMTDAALPVPGRRPRAPRQPHRAAAPDQRRRGAGPDGRARRPSSRTRRAARSRSSPRPTSTARRVWTGTSTMLRRGGGAEERQEARRPQAHRAGAERDVAAARRPRPPVRERVGRPQPDPPAPT